jgi:hypothetical protein
MCEAVTEIPSDVELAVRELSRGRGRVKGEIRSAAENALRIGQDAAASFRGVDIWRLVEALGAVVDVLEGGIVAGLRLRGAYDPETGRITVYRVGWSERDIETAVAHELYHHLEATGRVVRLPMRESEVAAHAFAKDILELTALPMADE